MGARHPPSSGVAFSWSLSSFVKIDQKSDQQNKWQFKLTAFSETPTNEGGGLTNQV